MNGSADDHETDPKAKRGAMTLDEALAEGKRRYGFAVPLQGYAPGEVMGGKSRWSADPRDDGAILFCETNSPSNPDPEAVGRDDWAYCSRELVPPDDIDWRVPDLTDIQFTFLAERRAGLG